MRRSVWGTAITALAVIALVGCASATAPTGATASPEASPTATPTPTPTPDPVQAAVARMSLAQQASSVVMGTIPGTDTAALRAFMTSGADGAPLGGFILMGDNIAADAAAERTVTDALTPDAALPPLIAIDQEGGYVSRLRWDRLPGGRGLQADDPAQVQQIFAQRAKMVAETGANLNFGVIADVPASPTAFIAPRALGADPPSAAARVTAAVNGEKGVVLSTLKHFPGHGATPGDSHVSIPHTDMTLAQWQQGPAVPFQAGIDAGAEVLMFGHLAYTAVDSAPASLSPRWHQIARDELGFAGLMITDDIGMLTSSGVPAYRDLVADGVAAIVAGNDMVLVIAGSTPQTAGQVARAIVLAVQDGRLPAGRLRDAAEHVMALRMQLALRQAQ
ncbi:glycoside hydrolase family 3 N-terminal domain-containing protein [uncultured Microbacterium sp.]|uniref:glycoside hydrolase family 3 N-terminal domain-containing protein n=1 Tax=uncultured Microbacterium sp. TaxID=191216 RepID=UPI00260C715D|nr:glycoside hydrolase family 3 N-terminal domain-containing protein [uncultured Microbacterium sp.]